MARRTGVSRRQFLGTGLRAGLALPAAGLPWLGSYRGGPSSGRANGHSYFGSRPLFPDPSIGWRGDSSVAAAFRVGALEAPGIQRSAPPKLRPAASSAPLQQALSERFTDLRRHFIFEYYPWYGGPPDYRHWDYLGRNPPDDLSSPYVPKLGPYDVGSTAVLEQHARWIVEAGAGAIALSWWGRGHYTDQAVPAILDVMKDHGIKVTFALEPYRDDRAQRYADDILYLVREYGEKRAWDAFLVLRNEDGAEGPVFKGFRCILPREVTDCVNVTRPVRDYTPDDLWRRQTDSLRQSLRLEFDHVTLLADSLEFARTPASGFDGIGIYDNFVLPADYAPYAAGASRAGLVFSFNVNPGYDQIEPRDVDPVEDPCYAPRPFAPPTEALEWSRADERERAARLSALRIRESLAATLRVQTDPELTNVRRGFFLVYMNSFNEWHEGHAFEPMMDWADLRPQDRAHGYHNPEQGDYRLTTLRAALRDVLERGPRDAQPEA